LEEQVKQPLFSRFEMGMGTAENVVRRISAIPEYRRLFKRIFKSDGLTIKTISKAIAAYERTLLSANSPFDRFINGNNTAITIAQRRGWELFIGKAKCSDCHVHTLVAPFFTDGKFHMLANSEFMDLLLPCGNGDLDVPRPHQRGKHYGRAGGPP